MVGGGRHVEGRRGSGMMSRCRMSLNKSLTESKFPTHRPPSNVAREPDEAANACVVRLELMEYFMDSPSLPASPIRTFLMSADFMFAENTIQCHVSFRILISRGRIECKVYSANSWAQVGSGDRIERSLVCKRPSRWMSAYHESTSQLVGKAMDDISMLCEKKEKTSYHEGKT